MGNAQHSYAIEAQPGLFRHRLRARLAGRGLRVGVSNLSRFFKRHGITRQKTPATRASSVGKM
jgi:hypothetical protein